MSMSSLNISIAFVALLIFIWPNDFSEAKRFVKFSKFQCQSFDESFGQFNRCAIKAVKRDVSELNVYFILKNQVKNNIVLNMFVGKRGNARNPRIYNITIDVCQFLENRKKQPLMNIFYKTMGFEDFSNINHTCPYEGILYIKGYRMNEKYITLLPLPLGHYWITMKWYLTKQYMAIIDFAFEFLEK